MKTRTIATLGTLALLAAGAAFGQTKLAADIPFEFSVSNRTMPAGQYVVSETPAAVLLSCYTCGASAFVAVSNMGAVDTMKIDSHLVFHKYGDKYFLGEVWYSEWPNPAAEVITSKTEREAAKSTADVSRVQLPMVKAAATVAAVR